MMKWVIVISFLFLLTGCPAKVTTEIICTHVDEDAILPEEEVDIDEDAFEPAIIQWGSEGDDEPTSLVLENTGGVFIAGKTTGAFPGNSNDGDSDVFITYVNENNNLAWTSQWGSAGYDSAQSIFLDSDHNLIVVGRWDAVRNEEINFEVGSMFVAGTNEKGEKVWQKEWGSPTPQEFISSATISTDGYIYATGFTLGTISGDINNGLSDLFVSKLSKDGSTIWSGQWGSTALDVGSSITTDNNGNSYITGWTYGSFESLTKFGVIDALMLRVASDGTVNWTEQYGTLNVTEGKSIAVDSNNNVYIAGKKLGEFGAISISTDSDGFLMKYSAEKNREWIRLLETDREEEVLDVKVVDDTIYITGWTDGTLSDSFQNAGGKDLFFAIYKSDGTKVNVTQFGTDGNDEGRRIMVSGNNVYVVGITDGAFDGFQSSGGTDIFLLRYNL